MSQQGARKDYISEQELREHFSSIEMPRIPVECIKTPPFAPSIASFATEVFTAHGIEIEDQQDFCLVRFPKGTYKTELLPRLPQTERYKIVLPDSYELHEVCSRGDERSYLQIPSINQPTS